VNSSCNFKVMKFFLFVQSVVISSALFAQKQSVTFRVEGVCGMCETRIENALDVPGVVMADWNVESKLLTVVYRSNKLTEDALHDLLHEVGHDTSAGQATDEQYAGLHGCCKYREGASCPHEDQR
jgi:periplasmic mercuric ion binding protein